MPFDHVSQKGGTSGVEQGARLTCTSQSSSVKCVQLPFWSELEAETLFVLVIVAVFLTSQKIKFDVPNLG